MKRCFVFLALFLTSSWLFADGYKIYGTISQLYENNKTLIIDSVNGASMAVKVMPNTEIDMDNCGLFGMDKQGKWKDLKVGEFVEMKLYYQAKSEATTLVKEIQIDCDKKAY